MCSFVQSKVWKEWGFLAHWVNATGLDGIHMLQRIEECEPAPITVGGLRPLRKVYTRTARQEVLQHTKGRSPTLRILKQAANGAQRSMWFEWHWTRAVEKQMVADEKSMALCMLLSVRASEYRIFYHLCINLWDCARSQ